MAAPVLQFKRGLLTNLPGLRAGEPGFTTDSYDLYVGLTSETSTNKFFGSHRYWIKETTSTGSGVNVVEGTSNGSSYITLKSPDSLAGIVTYTLPGTDGLNGQVLSTNGSGTLSFIDAAAQLNIAGGIGTDTVSLLTDTLTFAGTASEIETTVTDNQVQIGLPDNVIVGSALTVTGALSANGDVTLGDAGSDIVTVVGVATFTTSNVYIDNQLFVGGLQVNGGASIVGQDINARHLNLTGIATVTGQIDGNGGADISGGETTLSSATVSDLTSGRVVLAGTSGSLEDSGNLTFNGSTLTVVGLADLDDVNVSSAATIASLTLANAGVAVTAILDEDTMTSDRADAIPTQQSVKAYVDTEISNIDLTITTAEGTNGTGGGGGSVSTSQTLTFAGTTNEIDVTVAGQTVTYGLPNDVTIGNDLTVSGNLYVNGSTTQVNTSSLTVEDRTIELGIVNGSAPSSTTTWDLGLLFNYYQTSAKKSAVVWEQSVSRFVFGSEVSDGGGTDANSPQITFSSYAPIEVGSLWVNDCAGQSQVISCTGSERFLENITVDAGTF